MSDEPSPGDGAPSRRLDDVNIDKIGQQLIDLGEQLIIIGKHGDSHKLRDRMREAEESGLEEIWEDVDRELTTAARRTLRGLGSFRKEYSELERLAVEYALVRRGFSQREVAALLGVGVGTVNRWAQSPLTYGE